MCLSFLVYLFCWLFLLFSIVFHWWQVKYRTKPRSSKGNTRECTIHGKCFISMVNWQTWLCCRRRVSCLLYYWRNLMLCFSWFPGVLFITWMGANSAILRGKSVSFTKVFDTRHMEFLSYCTVVPVLLLGASHSWWRVILVACTVVVFFCSP